MHEGASFDASNTGRLALNRPRKIRKAVAHTRELRRRSAIEAVIGHMKTDGHLDRNFLNGRDGDHANAVLSAVGHNLRLVLKWLRFLLSQILAAILGAFRPKTALNPAS